MWTVPGRRAQPPGGQTLTAAQKGKLLGQMHLNLQKNKVGPLPHTIYKN